MKNIIALIILAVSSSSAESFLIVGKPQRAQTVQQFARKSIGELVFFTSSILFIRSFSPVWTGTDKSYHSLLALIGIVGIGSAQNTPIDSELIGVDMGSQRYKLFQELRANGKETNTSTTNWELVYQNIQTECDDNDAKELNLESCIFYQLHIARNNSHKERKTDSIVMSLNIDESLSKQNNRSGLYNFAFSSNNRTYEVFPGEFFLVTTELGYNTWVSYDDSELFIWIH